MPFSEQTPSQTFSWHYEHRESGWEDLESENSRDLHFPNLEKSVVKMLLKITGPDDVVYTSEQPICVHTPKESIFSQLRTVVDSDSDLVSKTTIPLKSEDQHASDACELKPVIDVRKRVFGPDIITKKYGVLCLKRFATIQVGRWKCIHMYRLLVLFYLQRVLHQCLFLVGGLELRRSRSRSTLSTGSSTSLE